MVYYLCHVDRTAKLITLCCDWSFHMPDSYVTGLGVMLYCKQTIFSPEGWGLGMRLKAM